MRTIPNYFPIYILLNVNDKSNPISINVNTSFTPFEWQIQRNLKTDKPTKLKNLVTNDSRWHSATHFRLSYGIVLLLNPCQTKGFS